MKKVFDCFLYNGEFDVLLIRLHELDEVVTEFVVTESDITFSGWKKGISFNIEDPRLKEFKHKIRLNAVVDMPNTGIPWVREQFQRNALIRGLQANPDDLVLISDVDEIPSAEAVKLAVADEGHSSFGFQLKFYYFYVNYQNVAGPESDRVWSGAALADEFNFITPQNLRYMLIGHNAPHSRTLKQAGWHFSFMGGTEEITRKIQSYSHQEYNSPIFFQQLNIDKLIREGKDLFWRNDYKWEIVDINECDGLPRWLRSQEQNMYHLFLESKAIGAL